MMNWSNTGEAAEILVWKFFEGERMKTGGRCVEGIRWKGMGKSMGGFDNIKQDRIWRKLLSVTMADSVLY